MIINSINDIIIYLKKNKMWSNLKDMSEKTGIHYSFLSELKNKKRTLTDELLARINSAYSTDFGFDYNHKTQLNKNTSKIETNENILQDVKYHSTNAILEKMARSLEILAESDKIKSETLLQNARNEEKQIELSNKLAMIIENSFKK